MGSFFSSSMPNYSKLSSCLTDVYQGSDVLKQNIIHKTGEPVIVPKNIFLERMNKSCAGLFEGFDWTNAVLAGGSVLGFLEKEELQSQYASSDLDIFVYEDNHEALLKRLLYVVTHLSQKAKSTSFSIYKNTYTINVSDRVQIIGLLYKTSSEVLRHFDLTHSQVGFDGSDLVYTPEFETTMISRVSKPTKKATQAYRIDKALNRGFMLNRDGSMVDLNNKTSYNYVWRPDNKGERCSLELVTLEQLRISHELRVKNYSDRQSYINTYNKLEDLVSYVNSLQIKSLLLR